MAFAFQSGAERAVVFDDAVVDEGDAAGLVEVRVGVDLCWRSVGGPAGVGNAGGGRVETFRWPIGSCFFLKRRDFAGGFGNDDFITLDDRETSGVVAAIFKTFEPANENGGGG